MSIKTTVKKIPLVGPLLKKAYNIFVGTNFKGSANYWEERYQKGGNSGAGSYNQLAEFKAEIINSFVSNNNIETVIEFGSGDGNQLDLFHFKNYLGLDVSRTAIEYCQQKFEGDLTKTFMLIDNFNGEKADLTMSLDVIYHLVEDEVFENYMKHLFDSSRSYVIIYASNEEGYFGQEPTPHVRHRKFTDWVESNITDFKLKECVPNKFPFNGNDKISSFADFYIFERI